MHCALGSLRDCVWTFRSRAGRLALPRATSPRAFDSSRKTYPSRQSSGRAKTARVEPSPRRARGLRVRSEALSRPLPSQSEGRSRDEDDELSVVPSADPEPSLHPLSSGEYVKRQRSGIAGLQPASTVCEDMYCTDPGLNQLLISEGSSISRFFSQDEWERHRSVSRYWRHLFSTWKSTIFLRVLEPVLLATGFAALLALYNAKLAAMFSLPVFAIAPLAHQLSGGIVSLSLVFRTNNANRRVIDARSLLGKMSKCTRDLTRMCQYVPNQEGCRLDILKHLRAFPYAMEAHVRKGRTRGSESDPTAFRVDPVPDGAGARAEARAAAGGLREHPVAGAAGHESDSEQGADDGHEHADASAVRDHCQGALFGALGEREDPVHAHPHLVHAHTSRILTLWLLTLPFRCGCSSERR